MSFSRFIRYLWDLLSSLARSIFKAIINAHQVIAYWRNRINDSGGKQAPQTISLAGQGTSLNVNRFSVQDNHRTNSKHTSIGASGLDTSLRQIERHKSINSVASPGKTPKQSRISIRSLFRSLSIRNFMEYCVIALNEASSSSYSNKFDPNACAGQLWLLGKRYELPQDVQQLLNDVRSRLWITYRMNFPPIDENGRYTTDKGFGCMIRCGQMVLANAFIQKNLGREWRWSPGGFDLNPKVYSDILRLFQDKVESPYSIHNIVRVGQHEGKFVGEWFGPNTIAQALKRISSEMSAKVNTRKESLISIDAALDNIIVIDEIKLKFQAKDGNNDNCNYASKESVTQEKEEDRKQDACVNDNGQTCPKSDMKTRGMSHQSTQEVKDSWTPGILFIQLRLGLTKINPIYFAALKKTFQFKNSLGIIGGRPNHALYLIGYTNDEIIYLDPHSTQQFIDLDAESEARSVNEGSGVLSRSPVTNIPTNSITDEQRARLSIDGSYHCGNPEKMSIDKLDPSLALCFYFDTEKDFDDWCEASDQQLIKTEQTPMFEIIKSRPSDWSVSWESTAVKNSNSGSEPFNEIGDINAEQDPDNPVIIERTDELLSGDHQKPTAKFDDEEFEMLG